MRLSKAIYNFTDTQDLRLAVGYRGKVNEKGTVRGVRYHFTSLLCCTIFLYSILNEAPTWQ